MNSPISSQTNRITEKMSLVSFYIKSI